MTNTKWIVNEQKGIWSGLDDKKPALTRGMGHAMKITFFC